MLVPMYGLFEQHVSLLIVDRADYILPMMIVKTMIYHYSIISISRAVLIA